MLVVQDQAAVIHEIHASQTLPSTVKVVVHDFFTQPTEYSGARVYILSHILYDWPDSDCIVIWLHLKSVMDKDSKVIISEMVLQETGAPWWLTPMDWTMMGMLVSKEHTESQWDALIEAAGLQMRGMWHKGGESGNEAMLKD